MFSFSSTFTTGTVAENCVRRPHGASKPVAECLRGTFDRIDTTGVLNHSLPGLRKADFVLVQERA